MINVLLGILLLILPASQPAPLDVRDFGAVPDDGVDDSAAIEAAINASQINQPIQFPAGTFDISRRLELRGDGRSLIGKTIISWEGDSPVASNQTFLRGSGTDSMFHFGGANLTISHLSFDGRAIMCDHENNGMVGPLVIDNCAFRINLPGNSNCINFTTGLIDSKIANCIFDPIHGDNGISGYNWKNLTIANNQFLNGNEGIHLVAFYDASANLLIEQNYFSGLHRMAIEVQGGGVETIVQDNFYENPVMSPRFADNNDTFAYSIIADRSLGSRVRRNTSIAPQRPDGKGVRIIFELGGEDVVCEDNYSVDGNGVAILNTSRRGRIINNRFGGFLESPSAYPGRAFDAIVKNNGENTPLTWNISRGKPGPNRRLDATSSKAN